MASQHWAVTVFPRGSPEGVSEGNRVGEQSHSFPQQQEVEADETEVLNPRRPSSLPPQLMNTVLGCLELLSPLLLWGAHLISGDNILDMW